MKKSITILVLLLLCCSAFGQLATEEVNRRLYEQLLEFPQEKIYLHIDKEAYVSGETIWFRAYLTDALEHIEDLAMSRYLYVDLLDPEGNVVYHYQIRSDERGLYHNNIVLAENLPEGYYRLRGYTKYMYMSRPQYIYERPLFIADPMRGRISVEASFQHSRNNNFSVRFIFRDRTDGEFISINSLKFRTGTRPLSEFPGKDEISFNLPDENRHIYIEFEHNSRLYRKYIPVLLPENEFDLAFFPEGGYLVAGSTNRVGFKAINSNGFSEDITGEVYQEDGRKVGELNTLHAGMGSFMLHAEPDKHYYALCRNENGEERRFELPHSNISAHTLHAQIVDSYLLIGYNSGMQAQPGSLAILIHMKGQVLHYAKIEPDRVLRIDKTTLPSGLLQVLLFDSNMNTLSERLLFCQNGLSTRTQITPDKQRYNSRELVKVKVKAEDLEQTGIKGWFSVSVTDDRDILPDTTRSIVSYLLLASELRGNIEEPEYYFSGKDRATEALDALMITQGWRRYDIPKTVMGEIEKPAGHIELGQEIAGKVTALLTKRPLNNSQIILFSSDNEYFSETLTDTDGRFSFNGFEFPDSTKYLLQALSATGRNSVEIKPDKYDTLSAKATIFEERLLNKQFLDYIVKSDRLYTQENGLRTIELAPVVISATRSYNNRSMYSSDLNSSIDIRDSKNIFSNIRVAIQMIPGLSISPHNIILIHKPWGTFPAVIILDDVIMSQGFDYTLIDGNSIERIEKVEGAQISMLGLRGGEGAVLFITKKGADAPQGPPVSNMIFANMSGYRRPVEFYSPKYETREQREAIAPDLRTTIYWKPDIWLSNGEAEFEFYTADNLGSYSVVIEGVTTEGEIIRQVEQILFR